MGLRKILWDFGDVYASSPSFKGIHLEGGVLVYGRDAGITNQHGNLFLNGLDVTVKECQFQDKENGYDLAVIAHL